MMPAGPCGSGESAKRRQSRWSSGPDALSGGRCSLTVSPNRRGYKLGKHARSAVWLRRGNLS
jgi:hypothetical protein